MTGDTDVEQAWRHYVRARERLLHAEEDDFDHRLRAFVAELRQNALASRVMQSLPAYDVHAWWSDAVARAEKSYAPAQLDFPAGEDERLASFAALLAFLADAATPSCTVQEFGAVLHCYKLADAVAIARELVIEPFCQLLETRLRACAARPVLSTRH